MKNNEQPVIAAVCGLFCEGCGVYIATLENNEKKLYLYAKMFGSTVEDIKCEGCRSEKVAAFCSGCEFVKCAKEKGVSFCGECDELPCEKLTEFQKAKPHRIELFEDFKSIADIGAHAWVLQMRKRYACSACGEINSAYDLKCRKCGHEPANEYVAEHAEAIRAYLKLLEENG